MVLAPRFGNVQIVDRIGQDRPSGQFGAGDACVELHAFAELICQVCVFTIHGFQFFDHLEQGFGFVTSGRFEVMQVQYSLLFQHPYSLDQPFGCMFAAHEAGMGIVTMRSLTGGIFQRWINAVRPDDDFDYSAALLQFTLSNPLIDVALVGMRTVEEVDRNIAVLNDADGRFDLDELHSKFV